MTGQHLHDRNSNKKNAVYSEQRPSLQRSISHPGEHIKLDGNSKTLKHTGDHWKKIKRMALERLNTFSVGTTMMDDRLQNQDKMNDAGVVLNRRLEYNLLPGAIFAMMAQRDEHGFPRIPVLLSLVKVQIIGADNSKPSDKKTSRKIRQLCIVVSYGNTRWIIHRRYWDFVKLHYSYYGYDFTHSRRPVGLPVFPAHPQLRQHKDRYQVTQQQQHQKQQLSNPPLLNTQISSLCSIDGGDQRSTTIDDATIRYDLQVGNYLLHKEHDPNIPLTTPESPASQAEADSYINHNQQCHNILGATNVNQHDKLLEQYIGQLIQATLHTGNINRLCKFLEISALGLHLKATQLYGHHGKEGYMAIVARTDRGPKHSRRSWPRLCFGSRPSGNSTDKDNDKLKWFIIRDNYMVCVNHPHDMDYYDVILFEPGFQIQRGYTHRSINKLDKLKLAITSAAKLSIGHSTLCIRTNAGEIYLRAKNVRQAIQFEQSLLQACRQSTWCLPPQRFNSFAPVRSNCSTTWFVDGKDYFYQISVALENATKHIYIHDWWLSPELYLRRPPSENEQWRLDNILKRKAEQGVKIYIIVYKEIAMAVPLFSHHTKQYLLSLSNNIYVQRHPSRTLDILSKQDTLFYAHHEKICMVDGVVAFIGGLDLCYGRYDTAQHILNDDPVSVAKQTWIGKDYSNPRVDDFHALDKPFEDNIDRSSLPRMPWHDISVRICGEAARDVEHHFVQRWNFLRRRKSSTPKRPTPLLLPYTTDVPDLNDPRIGSAHSALRTQVQILRSVSSWSSGVATTEHSIMDAYVELIGASKHFVYIENQFFVTSTQCGTTVIENKVGNALYNRILRAHQNKETWYAVVMMPLVPEFPGTFDGADGTTIRLIMSSQYLSIGRGPDSLLGKLRAAGVMNTSNYIKFYGLRNWGELNGSYVTEQVYIHAKTMIVDDRTVIIGSANINERSMLGVRDSEICACIEDVDLLDSTFGGQPVKVGRFAHSLRLRLMAEHMGLPVDDWNTDKLLHHAGTDKEATKKRKDSTTCHTLLHEPMPPTDSDQDTASYHLQEYTSNQVIDHKLLQNLTTNEEPTSSIINQIDSGITDTESTATSTIIDTTSSTVRYTMNEEALSLYKEWAAWDTDTDNNGDGFNHTPLALPLMVVPSDKKSTEIDSTDTQELVFCNNNNGFWATTDDDIVFASLRDPLMEASQNMWHTLARRNTDLFRRCFMVKPDNNVRTWAAFSTFTKMSRQLLMDGQVSKTTSLNFMRPFVPYLLNKIKGHLVIWPIGFMEDEGENFVFAMDKLAPLEIFD
ncbi:hypothetical protein BC941DRAFT_428409 [Chlamydoabsidia padenii]|nr:hypothetical protein BC941DRAFT_428409 [Chlamydoabsidia padenii]